MRSFHQWHRWLFAAALLALVVPVRAAEVDKYLPSDSALVLHVNVRQIVDSPLVKKHAVEKLREHLKEHEEASSILESLGFDPFKDLNSITVAGSTLENDGKGLIIAHGQFDAAKFEAKAEEEAKSHGDMLKIHKEGDKRIYEVQPPNDDKPLFVAVVDKTTLVASNEKDYVRDCFAKAAGKKEGGVKKEMKDLIEKVDAKSSMWVAMRGSTLNTGPLATVSDEKAKKTIEHIDSFTFTLTVDKGVKVVVDLVSKNAEGAKELAENVKEYIDMGKGFLALLAGQQPKVAPLVDVVNSVKVTTEGNAVSLKGEVGEDLIDKALKDQ
jgi:hypothetical protein